MLTVQVKVEVIINLMVLQSAEEARRAHALSQAAGMSCHMQESSIDEAARVTVALLALVPFGTQACKGPPEHDGASQLLAKSMKAQVCFAHDKADKKLAAVFR